MGRDGMDKGMHMCRHVQGCVAMDEGMGEACDGQGHEQGIDEGTVMIHSQS